MPSNYLLKRLYALVLCAFICSACACLGIQKHAKGIEPSFRPIVDERYEIVEPLELEVSSFRLFWLIPVTPEFKIKDSIMDAVRKKDGDNLIEMRIWFERQYWILGTVDILHINGVIVRYVE